MPAAKDRPRIDGAEQEFDFIFTYDPTVIVECAQALMLRVARWRTAPPNRTQQPVRRNPRPPGLMTAAVDVCITRAGMSEMADRSVAARNRYR